MVESLTVIQYLITHEYPSDSMVHDIKSSDCFLYCLLGATLIDVRIIETGGAQIKWVDIPTPCPVQAILYTFTAKRNTASITRERFLLLLT